MRWMTCGAIAGAVLFVQAARAETAAEAITAFGLLGSWSLDCSKPIACDQKICGSRAIYEVLPSGQPMSRSVFGPTASIPFQTVESEIHAATRIADDKIKIISTQLQSSSWLTVAWWRQPGERWEFVLTKSGDKIRFFSAKREDGKKIAAEDGFAVEHPPNTPIDQVPTSWVRTTKETLWLEKCSATADAAIISGITVRSNLSGYAVAFPTQPAEEVKDTPAGKLTLNLARDGDAMFFASEVVSILPDISSGLDSYVTNFLSRFLGAAVTAKQNVKFTTDSGRVLPALRFAFVAMDPFRAGKDIFGEGVVVASGRYLISAVASDLRSTNPTVKRFAIQKFLSSLRIE